MSILNFQKPDKILLQKATEFEGTFEFKPLEPGFGQTVGNALRRVLLSSLEGYAINAVRIGGVDHEFATIKGVVEDVVDIVLNLKQVRIKPVVQDDKNPQEKIYLTISGKEEFRASDIEAVAISRQKTEPPRTLRLGSFQLTRFIRQSKMWLIG